jgi:hypothetical protein
VESGQNPLVKKDCALLPIIILAEVEKRREPGKGEAKEIIPIRPIFGNSNVISLYTTNPRYRRKIRGFL